MPVTLTLSPGPAEVQCRAHAGHALLSGHRGPVALRQTNVDPRMAMTHDSLSHDSG